MRHSRHCFATHLLEQRRRPAHHSDCCWATATSSETTDLSPRVAAASQRDRSVHWMHLPISASRADRPAPRRCHGHPWRWPMCIRAMPAELLSIAAGLGSTWPHLKVLRRHPALPNRSARRTSSMSVRSCGHRRPSRSTPAATGTARSARPVHATAGWKRAPRDLLPTRYVHVVFTLPQQLAPLALQNKREIYGLLFRASAATLLAVARDPQASRRGDRLLQRIAHLESETAASSRMSIAWFRPAASLSITPVGSTAPPSSFSPLRSSATSSAASLSRVYARSTAMGACLLREACRHLRHGAGVRCLAASPVPLRLGGLLQTTLWRCGTCLRYLGHYTHRVAISNHRLVALADGIVTFRWRDSAHKNKKRLTRLAVNEFLRRFFLHVLPPGFVRIRHFGLLRPPPACRTSAALLSVTDRWLRRTGSARS